MPFGIKKRPQSPLQVRPWLAPGVRGLNTELSNLVGYIDPNWALDMQEVVYNAKGVIATRKGWVTQTSSPIVTAGDDKFDNLHEYLKDDGTRSVIAVADDSTNTAYYESTNDGVAFSDVTGSVAFTGTNSMFHNFNDSVIAFHPGEQPVIKSTGNFAAITLASGVLPISSGVGLAAFGRVWMVEDATSTIHYSALLDETRWATADGGGSIDLKNVWTRGKDEVIALIAFGSTFVVFGRKHIIMYVDGSGSILGIDPDNMYVVDTIEGTGAIARDAVVLVGEGDVLYLSAVGVQSLSRVVADKQNPRFDVTQNIRSLMTKLIANEPNARYTAKAVWSPADNFALFLFPGSTEIVMLDTRFPAEDHTMRAAEWRSQAHTSLLVRDDDTLLMGGDGEVQLHTGYRDDGGVADTVITMVYASAWDPGHPGEEALNKILKRAIFDLEGRATLTCTARWGVNKRGLEGSKTFTNENIVSGDEFAIGEFGEAEWSGGKRTRVGARVPLSKKGLTFKIYITIESTDVDEECSLQGYRVYYKTGLPS